MLADITTGYHASNVRPLRLTDPPNWGNWGPVWKPPTGNEIYYTTNRETYWDMMKTNLATSTESMVYRMPPYESVTQFRFSPDGTQFVGDYDAYGSKTLRIFNADGSTARTPYVRRPQQLLSLTGLPTDGQ